jgi:hypothetical protein
MTDKRYSVRSRQQEAAAILTLVMTKRIEDLPKEIVTCEGLLEQLAGDLPHESERAAKLNWAARGGFPRPFCGTVPHVAPRLGRGATAHMPKWFVIFSGTGIGERRKGPLIARDTLERVRALMRLRRPGVRIEDERGGPISSFQLIEADNESNAKRR